MNFRLTIVIAAALMAVAARAQSADPAIPLLKGPPGFVIKTLVRVPGARSMALGAGGTLFVATRRGDGQVFAVRGVFGPGPEVLTIASGLKMPNGIALHEGSLYIAEPSRILRLDDIEKHLDQPPELKVVVADLPYKNMLHSWKYIGFGPDGKLYVPLGVPCNVCDEPGFGVILRMNPDGSGRGVFARGIRNTVGMAWHPETGELWFTDNGRDMMGDDLPSCELNHAPRAGLDFGFPYCHGGTVADPEFGKLGRCEDATPPVQQLGPHVAPLGMAFYTGAMFPGEYRGQVFIAEHGSWNRSKAVAKTGYRVALVRIENGKATGYETFLDGFLDGDKIAGRPVDVLVAPDGALLVSDDTAGAIYRVSYQSPE